VSWPALAHSRHLRLGPLHCAGAATLRVRMWRCSRKAEQFAATPSERDIVGAPTSASSRLMATAMDPRRLADFPRPWTVSEGTGEFIVIDASGRPLAYFYWWGDPRTTLLTRDEARCLAEKFAKVPSLIAWSRDVTPSLP
jgi:hypothetical protein